MEAGRSYLLGTGQPYPKTWNRPYVIFAPASNGRGPVLGFADGAFADECGIIRVT